MEEYRPLAADGAAPGQTRLPWGDEPPTVSAETHEPGAVEAHPPEPITHFAAPEATFFTAEPPAPAVIDTDENGHRDGDEENPESPEEIASEEATDEEPAAEDPPDDDPVIDEGDEETPAAPTDDDAELEPAAWADEAVDDVWADDDVWAPPSVLDVGNEEEADQVWAPPSALDVDDEDVSVPPPAVDIAEEALTAPAPTEADAATVSEPPVAGDEIEAMLDELLPSAEELAPLEERPPVAETLPPWTPAPAIAQPVAEEPAAPEEPIAEEPVAEEPTAPEEPVVEEPVAEEVPAAEEAPVAEAPAPVEAPRMVSPSHPEWVEQERIVVDDAAPELEWADPEAADFGFAADSPTTTEADGGEDVASPTAEDDVAAAVASTPASPVAEEAPQPSEWFNPPEPEAEPAVEAPAAEWLTLPELDEQLAAVSESPPPDEELPPMVGEDEPLAPVASSAVVTGFERPLEQPVELEPEPTAPLVVEPVAREATIVDLPVPAAAPAAEDEPVVLPTVAAVPTRALGIRRIAMVAAALVMGTLVVRQLNPSALSGPPTFVGVTSGQASRSQSSRSDQPATAGSRSGSQHVAGAKTSTTVAGANATTGTTTAAGSTGATVAGGKTTGTTVAGGKTTPTTAAPPATTPASTAGYTSAKRACTDFNRAYVSRDNGSMTDDQADDVFVNTASEMYPAYQANSAKWGPMYNHALVLQKQLEGTVDSTDQQIEDQISAVYNDCKTAGLI
jgi:hypothetical protein